MKVFCVSKACNACGECILRTPLLMENEKGYAVPDPKGYIKEAEIADAELIVSKCPVQALTIIEKESVKQTGTEGLQVLSNKLKKVQDIRQAIKLKRLEKNSLRVFFGTNARRL